MRGKGCPRRHPRQRRRRTVHESRRSAGPSITPTRSCHGVELAPTSRSPTRVTQRPVRWALSRAAAPPTSSSRSMGARAIPLSHPLADGGDGMLSQTACFSRSLGSGLLQTTQTLRHPCCPRASDALRARQNHNGARCLLPGTTPAPPVAPSRRPGRQSSGPSPSSSATAPPRRRSHPVCLRW